MPRAVQTSRSFLIHLQLDGEDRAYCGIRPVKYAALIIKRVNMCSNCYGKDRDKYPASILGLDKIL